MKREWIGGCLMVAGLVFWLLVVRAGEAQVQALMSSFMGQVALSTAEGQAAVHQLAAQRALAFGLAMLGGLVWVWGWRSRNRERSR